MHTTQLKTNRLLKPVGIEPGLVAFSWICEGGQWQRAFRIVVTGDLSYDSGKILSSATEYELPVMVPSGAFCRWSVTLWDETDTPAETVTAAFETGLAPGDWRAQWIDPEPEEHIPAQDNQSLNPASYLQKRFFYEGGERARLYITAHGIYDVWINGTHVDGYFLAPGSSQYDKRLQVQTYDVGEFLKSGENELLVSLGDGWWRGCFGWGMRRNCWGDRLALLCQLEVDGKIVLTSDGSWQASQNGPLGLNDPMQLQQYDARKNITDWHNVCIRDFGYENLVGTALPVTLHERFQPTLLHTPAGQTVLDFGQNMAGFVELEMEAVGGEVITLTHGEVLDAEGNFQIRNFQNAEQPYCTQRVEYTCAPGKNCWHQTKGYYGFRYVLVETELPITGEEFTAVAVYSDMKQTSFFRCGHEGVNRLFQNCLWSMKSNFVDIPTDCPHREKAGFTGDLQVFSGAALYLMDCYPVLARYLTECAAGQREDGCVRQIVPYWTAKGAINGAAGWSDAFEILAWRLMHGFDSTVLTGRLYPELKNWMDYCIQRAEPSRPENEQLPLHIRRWLVDTATHWGEWCEPGWSATDYFKERDATGHAEFATAFLSYGCALMADIARRLGKQTDAVYFSEISQKAREAYRYVYLPDGKVHSQRQCHYVRPVAMGLLEQAEIQPVVDELAQRIRDNGGVIGTGFLTTCYLCDVLTDYGYSDVAYDLLLNTKQPGWLFEVEQGATTIWESWFGIRPDGSRRGSHNHYAFGAVSGWLMSRVAGIRVEDGAVVIRPYPDRRLGFAQARYDSPLGTVGSSWHYEGDKIVVEVQIPPNAKAELILPDGSKHALTAGKHSFLISA